MRPSSASNQATASLLLGVPFCTKPRRERPSQGMSPTSDQAPSVTLPAAISRASDLEAAGLGPKKSR